MTTFHEVRFPLRLALATSGGPVRRVDIVNLSNGRENRNSRWRRSRRAYDAGSGIRSVADLYEMLEFFEARGGALYGFRFRDPLDATSARPGVPVTATDQLIGTGDGANRIFALAKSYGDAAGRESRPIQKPVAGSVLVSVNGVTVDPARYSCDVTTGIVTFVSGETPAAGKAVRAGFEFDVPVRFVADTLDISLQSFKAGRIPTIPLVEIVP